MKGYGGKNMKAGQQPSGSKSRSTTPPKTARLGSRGKCPTPNLSTGPKYGGPHEKKS